MKKQGKNLRRCRVDFLPKNLYVNEQMVTD